MADPKQMVDVQLVADRQNHKDTMYGTDVVWLHQGDVRKIPAAAWPKMAAHPDVYCLAPPVTAAEADRQAAMKLASDATERLDEAIAEKKAVFATAAVLENMPDDIIRAEAAKRGYALHPKLGPANLRTKFLEAQDADDKVTKPA